jgi:hypothetical protein
LKLAELDVGRVGKGQLDHDRLLGEQQSCQGKQTGHKESFLRIFHHHSSTA